MSALGDDFQHLRVLIANEIRDRLELLARVVIGLGHDVIAREIYVKEVGAVTARERPDVALVGLGSSSDHALALISEIVREASCPVIAILHADDPAYVHEAAKRGVFAYIIDGTPEELQCAIDITLQRFSEYQSLQGAFGRRALIEQAKGILMARHSINADNAFEKTPRPLPTQRPQTQRRRRRRRRKPPPAPPAATSTDAARAARPRGSVARRNRCYRGSRCHSDRRRRSSHSHAGWSCTRSTSATGRHRGFDAGGIDDRHHA